MIIALVAIGLRTLPWPLDVGVAFLTPLLYVLPRVFPELQWEVG